MPPSPVRARRSANRWRVLVKELSAFGVVGAVCFVIQVGCFQLLYAHLGVGAVRSNLVATVVSMTAAYLGHRYWSFSHRARSGLARQYLLFVTINSVTLLLGLGIVALVRYPLGQESALILQLANVGSIMIGTVIRYLAYRQWVFLEPESSAPEETAGTARRAAPARSTVTPRRLAVGTDHAA